MSLVTEILDRLSGVAIVREQLSETTRNVDKLGSWLLDHEKRLAALEAESKLLPKKKTRRVSIDRLFAGRGPVQRFCPLFII